MIPPAELGELEAFRSLLSGDGIDDFFSRRSLAYGIPLTPDASELPGWLEALTSGTRA